jgi:predicted RNA-binding protein (virulence factor B family)
VKEFAVGDQVTHDRYGLGRVLGADESGVFVDFGTQQERISAPYTKLTKL